MSRLSLDISDEFHLKLKILTTWKGVSIKNFVIHALNKQIELEYKSRLSKNVLNDETIILIEESFQSINVNSCDSKEEFFKHLDKLQEEVEKYSDGEIKEVKIINDFLPAPKNLILKDNSVKKNL